MFLKHLCSKAIKKIQKMCQRLMIKRGTWTTKHRKFVGWMILREAKLLIDSCINSSDYLKPIHIKEFDSFLPSSCPCPIQLWLSVKGTNCFELQDEKFRSVVNMTIIFHICQENFTECRPILFPIVLNVRAPITGFFNKKLTRFIFVSSLSWFEKHKIFQHD